MPAADSMLPVRNYLKATVDGVFEVYGGAGSLVPWQRDFCRVSCGLESEIGILNFSKHCCSRFLPRLTLHRLSIVIQSRPSKWHIYPLPTMSLMAVEVKLQIAVAMGTVLLVALEQWTLGSCVGGQALPLGLEPQDWLIYIGDS